MSNRAKYLRIFSSTVLNLSNGSSEGKRGTGNGKVHLMKYPVSVYYGIYDGKSGRHILFFFYLLDSLMSSIFIVKLLLLLLCYIVHL